MAQDGQMDNANGGAQTSETPAYDYKSNIAPDYHSMWESKGWTNPNDALKSYANLENMLSAQDRLILPKDDTDEKAWGELYGKMGRPARAEDYKFDDMPEGVQRNEDLAKWFKENSFKMGLSQRQAAAMEREWNTYSQEFAGKMAAAEKAAAESELENLQRQWGADYEDRMLAAKNAAKTLGGEKVGSVIDALSSQIGVAETVTFFDNLAKRMGDPNFSVADAKAQGAGGGMNPQSAMKEIEKLQMDPDYLDPSKNPARHADLQKRAQELFAAAYPEDSVDNKSRSFNV